MTTTTDRSADATTAMIAALRRGAYIVTTCVDGSVTVDGERIESRQWDDMVMSWDGTADGLEDLGWEAAADAMRDDE